MKEIFEPVRSVQILVSNLEVIENAESFLHITHKSGKEKRIQLVSKLYTLTGSHPLLNSRAASKKLPPSARETPAKSSA